MHSRLRSGLGLASLVTLSTFAAAACAGKTSTQTAPGEDGGTTADGGRVDGSPLPPDCPATLPAQDVACKKEGLLCEYGDDRNPICNTVRVCSSSGKWASPIYYGGVRACPSPPDTTPPNPASCPATRSAITNGAACKPKDLACNYEGSACKCGSFCPSYPVGQRPCDPDAGVTTNCCDTSKIEWYCFDGPKPCPSPRPRVGTACTTVDEQCAVTEPVECGQTVMTCNTDHVWNVLSNPCPISTAAAKDDIHYVSAEEAERLRQELMKLKLATYRYKTETAPPSHLGFIIEDTPAGSPAVMPSRDRVDLYAYLSMAVATLQRQEREIESLKAEVARLSKERPKAATPRR